jgi:hypothetical protein
LFCGVTGAYGSCGRQGREIMGKRTLRAGPIYVEGLGYRAHPAGEVLASD